MRNKSKGIKNKRVIHDVVSVIIKTLSNLFNTRTQVKDFMSVATSPNPEFKCKFQVFGFWQALSIDSDIY